MSNTPLAAQGWYPDPYGRHQTRWFSAGSPTALVRDDRVESWIPPPDRVLTDQLETASR